MVCPITKCLTNYLAKYANLGGRNEEHLLQTVVKNNKKSEMLI